MKKALIIGGTYFAGRVYAILASRTGEYELTFINRGRYSMKHLPNVKEHICDRHDIGSIGMLPAEDYDVCVDFCAYEQRDIRSFVEAYKGTIKQYIYISTADVYERDGSLELKDENSAVMQTNPGGPAGDYMFKKARLEKECRTVCEENGIKYTILRPAFLYGPFNYAPRESFFIEKIVRHKPVPVPADASSKFVFAYITDLGDAILRCTGNETAYGKAYNICAPEIQTYESYIEMLKEVADREFTVEAVTCEQVEKENIGVPFPLYENESEMYDGSLISRELGLAYTPFKEGMKKAYNAFKGVYE